MNQRVMMMRRGMGDVMNNDGQDFNDFYFINDNQLSVDGEVYDIAPYDPSLNPGGVGSGGYGSEIYVDDNGYRVDLDGYFLDEDGNTTNMPFRIPDSLMSSVIRLSSLMSNAIGGANQAARPPQINPQTRQPISNQTGAGAGSQVGNAAGSFVDQLFKTVLQNPLVFLAGGIGLFLYMQEPQGGTSRR
jgi:hypothetical protein